MSFDISSYDFDLPDESIAQEPTANRGESRLLHVNCNDHTLSDGMFSSLLDLVQPGDIFVVNDTKVFPARLHGRKETGGKVELLLLEYPKQKGRQNLAEGRGLLKSSKRPKVGSSLHFGSEFGAIVKDIKADGSVVVDLVWEGELGDVLSKHGHVPLPPYIKRLSGPGEQDRQRYQTVYADKDGAVAAPTAGLHLTDKFLQALTLKGVSFAAITLHVGYGTFSPVRVDDIRQHKIHSEYVSISNETVEAIKAVRESGGRVWAVGTTSARALEYASDGKGGVLQKEGSCEIYIYPGYEFRVVDNLITNFHLPKSSLLFMVSAFAGRDLIMNAYAKALKDGYRFFSYGDAMVLTK